MRRLFEKRQLRALSRRVHPRMGGGILVKAEEGRAALDKEEVEDLIKGNIQLAGIREGRTCRISVLIECLHQSSTQMSTTGEY